MQVNSFSKHVLLFSAAKSVVHFLQPSWSVGEISFQAVQCMVYRGKAGDTVLISVIWREKKQKILYIS